MNISKFEKYAFPFFLLVFQVIFIILYGLLVRYDESGGPHVNLTVSEDVQDFVRNLESTQTTLKVYPCQ